MIYDCTYDGFSIWLIDWSLVRLFGCLIDRSIVRFIVRYPLLRFSSSYPIQLINPLSQITSLSLVCHQDALIRLSTIDWFESQYATDIFVIYRHIAFIHHADLSYNRASCHHCSLLPILSHTCCISISNNHRDHQQSDEFIVDKQIPSFIQSNGTKHRHPCTNTWDI